MDAHALYVALTRHRFEVNLYYAQEDFPDFASLLKSAGRVSYKDLVIDYSISQENQEYWLNVQDYKALGQEMLATCALARKADKPEQEAIWKDYRRLQTERSYLAKFILADRDSHRDFIRQGGLTFETLEIAARLKQRPLSRLEIEAQVRVEHYAAAALECRTLWRQIRRTHPGTRSQSHEDWSKYEEARVYRGVLANQIHSNPLLHRPFLKEAALHLAEERQGEKISYSLQTIRAQAEAHQSKMLQQAILKDAPDPVRIERLQVLLAYTETRDQASSVWQEVKPKLKSVEGTLLQGTYAKAIEEYQELRKLRDAKAAQIVENLSEYEKLAEQVGIKLDGEKLKEQAAQNRRDTLIDTYHTAEEVTAERNHIN